MQKLQILMANIHCVMHLNGHHHVHTAANHVAAFNAVVMMVYVWGLVYCGFAGRKHKIYIIHVTRGRPLLQDDAITAKG